MSLLDCLFRREAPQPRGQVLLLTAPCPVCCPKARAQWGIPPNPDCVGCRGCGRVVPSHARWLKESLYQVAHPRGCR